MTHTGTVIGKNGKLQVIACVECGYAHLFPLPTERELQEYYRRGFYEGKAKDWYKESRADLDWITASLRTEFGLLELPKRGANALLDVGAGFGDCLAYARGLGWDAAGLEPSPRACELLANAHLPYQQGYVETTRLAANTADVIRAAWVLEHLLNPGAVLDKFHTALKLSGKLLLTVPNDFTNIQQVAKRTLKKREDWWVHHTHINYWNLQTLNTLLHRHGFFIVQFYSTYPMEMFLLQGFDYIGNRKVGDQVHAQRKRFELEMHANSRGVEDLVHLQQSWAACGMGRDLVILGVKQ